MQDVNQSHFDRQGGKRASDLAVKVGELLGTNKISVYNAFKEWKEGTILQGDNNREPRLEVFLKPTMGAYKRHFLLNEEDLKMKFKKWMQKNFCKLTVSLAWEYLNTKLLKQVVDATLLSHKINLPIFQTTTSEWIKKCKDRRCNTKKTYYNDQHQNKEFIKHRNLYIKTLGQLQRRMRVWFILSKDDKEEYFEC